jgi:small subunit ribosomal protein S18
MIQDYFSQNNIKYVDYKDIDILKKFISPSAKIVSRRKTGLSAKNQRLVAEAVKRARFMGLLPYIAN